MTERRKHTFALVVFGGSVFDAALATDFVMISKKFMADGLDPTCLSGTHLQDITNINGPFLFGREDLRQRVPIYDNEEAMTPFYQLERHYLKRPILDWVTRTSNEVRAGDRIVMVLIGHGSDDGDTELNLQCGETEYLPKAEMIAALSVLPRDIRLLFVNEACYSGTWATMAPDLGTQRDVLVETAATINERSWSYTSGSGRNRCSMFGAAFIEELTTHPEGQISQHRCRIVDEMLFVEPHQKTSTPLVVPSARALLSYNIAHFILTPKIATAITEVASAQDRHEVLLKSRASFHTFWRQIRNKLGPDRKPAEAFGVDSSARDSIEVDMKALVIESYLKDLGSNAAAIDYSTLVCACWCALEGRGPPDIPDQVVATISWQAVQMRRVSQLLDRLAKKGLITDIVDVDTAKKTVAEHWEDVLVPIGKELRDHTACLSRPPRKGHIMISFNDASLWLLHVLAYNRLEYPDKFDIKQVKSEVGAFFASVKLISIATLPFACIC